MRISYSTSPGNLNTTVGFGVAGFQLIKSLQRLGHEVPYSDKKAPVQINFAHPSWWSFYKDQYKIGYTPWESTALQPGWQQHIDAVDELWVTSPWLAGVFKDTHPNIHVYEHGIDPLYKTVKRRGNGDKFKFLHIGAPSVRKGADLTIKAFIEVFGGRSDVTLTMKGTPEFKLGGEEIIYPDNVSFINKQMTREELRDLYLDHDVFVYPTWGEGFGLMPLEALATGMPVIATDEILPYRDWTIPLYGEWTESPWQSMHPGQMIKPDYDELCRLMKRVYNLSDLYSGAFESQARDVHARYDWDTLTASAWDHIVKKFDS